MDFWEIENGLFSDGFSLVAGVDEAGRGPLAGPVYAAAVILPREITIAGLDDSKKLTEKKREALFDVIMQEAVSYGIASASHKEIDEINILNATFLAMNRAIGMLCPPPDICIIDGNRSAGVEYKNICAVKGDSCSASVAAASILAKVSRDRYMLRMAEQYPEYEFGQHKGYGTKLHYEKLRQFGPSEIHRKTFLKKMHQEKSLNTKLLGRWGEAQAAGHLREKGYTITGLGYCTRFGEIDIIAENKKFIVFTEVKLRRDASFASAREFVNTGKKRHIILAAKQWLSENETEKQPRFDVIEVYAPDGQNTKYPVVNHIENAFGEGF